MPRKKLSARHKEMARYFVANPCTNRSLAEKFGFHERVVGDIKQSKPWAQYTAYMEQRKDEVMIDKMTDMDIIEQLNARAGLNHISELLATDQMELSDTEKGHKVDVSKFSINLVKKQEEVAAVTSATTININNMQVNIEDLTSEQKLEHIMDMTMGKLE